MEEYSKILWGHFYIVEKTGTANLMIYLKQQYDTSKRNSQDSTADKEQVQNKAYVRVSSLEISIIGIWENSAPLKMPVKIWVIWVQKIPRSRNMWY